MNAVVLAGWGPEPARRLHYVRVSTWCLVPIVLLVAIAIAQVRN